MGGYIIHHPLCHSTLSCKISEALIIQPIPWNNALIYDTLGEVSKYLLLLQSPLGLALPKSLRGQAAILSNRHCTEGERQEQHRCRRHNSIIS